MNTLKQIAALLAAFTLTAHAASEPPFCGGDGSESNPHQICTAEQLAHLATFVNDGNPTEGVHYILANSIDLTAYLASTDAGW